VQSSTRNFLADFHDMSTFGATPGGGIDRQAASRDDIAVREWFGAKVADYGGRTVFDEIGNQFGLFELNPGSPWVFVGSHLDSQPLAGRFDGSYGVLAALHAVADVSERLRASEVRPEMNLAVANWFNEEGSRFSPSMMGSSVYTGMLDIEDARAATDAQGTTVAQAQQAAAWSPVVSGDDVPQASAYLEIHVEQGKELETAGVPLGLVTATWGARKFQVTVHGEQGHTGSTLMADRQDALFGAALIITGVRRMTDEVSPGTLQASVSTMKVLPNSPVTIAREVQMNLDLRSPDPELLSWAQQRVDGIVAAAREEARVSVDTVLTHQWDRNPYPRDGVDLARSVAEQIGISYREVQTVAGHDSTNMKETVPTVMLFVPSVDGISHNERELTSDGDMLAGLEMLAAAVERVMFSISRQ
jgi:N-carbamoyl-L-amino-acid hydrolase